MYERYHRFVRSPRRPGGVNSACNTRRAGRLLCGGLLAALAGCQTLPRLTPSEAGFDESGLAEVHAFLQREVAEGRLVGAVALVARDGGIVYRDAVGWSDREQREPMTAEAVFPIFSMTKPVTSAAVMILYEDGRIGLDDPVERYLPELAGMRVAADTGKPVVQGGERFFSSGWARTGPQFASATAAGLAPPAWTLASAFSAAPGDDPQAGLPTVALERPITIRDLLRHTSGIPYGYFDQSRVDTLYAQADLYNPSRTLAEVIKELSHLPLKHQPGARWEYGYSTDVLARVVEVVSGLPLEQFLSDRIFEPLGMHDTGYQISPQQAADRVSVYRRQPSGELQPFADINAVNATTAPTLIAGGMGLYTTAEDYLRFAQMLLNGGQLGSARILRASTVKLMTSDQLGEIPKMNLMGGLLDDYGFGLGVAVRRERPEDGRTGHVGEYFWLGAAGTGFWVDPQAELAAVLLTSHWMEFNALHGFRAALYKAVRR